MSPTTHSAGSGGGHRNRRITDFEHVLVVGDDLAALIQLHTAERDVVEGRTAAVETEGIGEAVALPVAGDIIRAVVPGFEHCAEDIGMRVAHGHGRTGNGFDGLAVFIQASFTPGLEFFGGLALEKNS